MCGNLHKVCAHFVRSGILQAKCRLVHARYHRPSDCHLYGIRPPGRVSDCSHALGGKLLDGASDGCIVVHAAQRNLHIGAVKCLFKLMCSGACRCQRQIAKCARCFLVSCLQYLLQVLRCRNRRRIEPLPAINRIIGFQCRCACFLHELPQFLVGSARQRFQPCQNLLSYHPCLLKHFCLMLHRRNPVIVCADSSCHIRQYVRLRLCVQLYHAIRHTL